jgi:hypothetical protein
MYWSLLITPSAGVTYGGQGVWGWDNGTAPPVGHPNTGTPLPWQEALMMEGAEQIRYLWDVFESIEWWRLRPAPEVLAFQPGVEIRSHFIAASKSDEGDLAVIYIPEDREVVLNLECLRDDRASIWFNPRTGARLPVDHRGKRFVTPGPGDWVLVLRS